MAALPKTLSFVSYAVNGHGLGHLMRMIAVNRWVRRYAAYAGIKSQHWFLTTSEADTLYDHTNDPGETTNVAANAPDVVANMLARLQAENPSYTFDHGQ